MTSGEPELFRHLPFPFPDDVFPSELGAIVQVSVLEGREPAREVVHAPDGSWSVGDLVNDPNLPGAVVATHIWHAILRNSSMTLLATLPPGHIATRTEPGQPWRVETLQGWGDD